MTQKRSRSVRGAAVGNTGQAGRWLPTPPIDSRPIAVCHNKHIRRHKVFTGLARQGKNSLGWFYGFKLHLIINELPKSKDVGFLSQLRLEAKSKRVVQDMAHKIS